MANGELVEDKIVEKLSLDEPKEQVQRILDACKDVSGENSCEKAFKMFECYLSNKN